MVIAKKERQADQYSRILRSLSQEEQTELFEIKRKYNWILHKLKTGAPLRGIENDWLQTRPHYVASEKIGVDIVEGELIYVR